MIRIKNILVPTDFSDFARYALDYALAFAQAFKAKITLIHVTPEREMDAIRQVSTFFEPGQLEKLMKERESEDQRQLDELIPADLKKGIEVETIHTVGIPFMDIIRTAREKKVDLIIIATHGRSGLSHMLFGSVAEHVVRKAPCPVLSIRHPEYKFVMP
jgi:nucleotide-binding universal stress UspA family protein